MQSNDKIDSRLTEIEEEWFGQACHTDVRWLLALVRLQRLALTAAHGTELMPRHIQALASTALQGIGLPETPSSKGEITLTFSVPPQEMY